MKGKKRGSREGQSFSEREAKR